MTSYFGLSMENSLFGAKIKFQPTCNYCSDTAYSLIHMKCMINGLSSYTTSSYASINLI